MPCQQLSICYSNDWKCQEIVFIAYRLWPLIWQLGYHVHFDLVLICAYDAVQDPHGELTKQNVLIERGDVSKTASAFSLTVDQVQMVLQDARQRLWQRRQLRPRPHLDNKMITAWNGLPSCTLLCIVCL